MIALLCIIAIFHCLSLGKIPFSEAASKHNCLIFQDNDLPVQNWLSSDKPGQL